MVTSSFWCRAEHLVLLQELVKSTGGHFMYPGPPPLYPNRSNGISHYVTIVFPHGSNFSGFSETWESMHINITETRAPWWKRLMRKVKGRVLAFA